MNTARPLAGAAVLSRKPGLPSCRPVADIYADPFAYPFAYPLKTSLPRGKKPRPAHTAGPSVPNPFSDLFPSFFRALFFSDLFRLFGVPVAPLCPPVAMLEDFGRFWDPFWLPFCTVFDHFAVLFSDLVLVSILEGFLIIFWSPDDGKKPF